MHLTSIPVALVDDVMALYVLRHLDKEKRAACLVFPLSNESVASGTKKWMPEYLVGLSVKRTNLELSDYLQDALRLFLRTEVQMISTFYAEVCLEFEDFATETCAANRTWSGQYTELIDGQAAAGNRPCGRAWVEYTFGLTPTQLKVHQDFELPWNPILLHAQKIYHRKRRKASAN